MNATPADLNRERALLGAALLDAPTTRLLVRELTAADFAAETNATVFSAIVAVARAGERPWVGNVARELEKAGVLGRVGGRAALEELVRDRWELRIVRDAFDEVRRAMPPVEEEPVAQMAREILGSVGTCAASPPPAPDTDVLGPD